MTLKYKKKRKKRKRKKEKRRMGSNKRMSSKDLRLLGWRLNPFLPGALADKLQERAVIHRKYYKMARCTTR